MPASYEVATDRGRKKGTLVAKIDVTKCGNRRRAESIARLISAVPDLYSAATDLLERHNEKLGDKGPCFCEDCVSMLDALEKVEGKRL